jgi:hypothetical protein
MAYPFAQAPTFEIFVENLVRNHGCERRSLPNILHGPRGAVTIEYLARMVDGRELYSEPLPEHLGEMLSPDSARRIIVQLKLPREVWTWAGDPYTIPDDDWD